MMPPLPSLSPSSRRLPAFTLVEILIVVVILGILAAIVTPQFTSATGEASAKTTYSELQKIRRHVEMYKVWHSNRLPNVSETDGGWGELIGPNHLLAPPVNSWVGGTNSRVIAFGTSADLVYQRDYGWIYDPATGDIWAGGFDENDQPLAR